MTKNEMREKLLLIEKEYNLKSVTSDKGRVYRSSKGNEYPSVTTILSKTKDKKFLIEWKKKVGEKEANRITKAATNRGTSMHKMIEDFYAGIEVKTDNLVARELYNSIKKELLRLEPIVLEYPLFSDKLMVAGRTDCIGSFDDKLSIIDFKSSKKLKRLSWVEDYFIQTTLYSLMLFEMTGIMCKNMVLLIAVENDSPQVFESAVKDYVGVALTRVKDYYSLNNDTTLTEEHYLME